jgi:DNA polymerase IV
VYGLPLAVVDRVVSCASYEARAPGVHAGTRAADAHRACPNLVTVPSWSEACERAGAELFALLRRRGMRCQRRRNAAPERTPHR